MPTSPSARPPATTTSTLAQMPAGSRRSAPHIRVIRIYRWTSLKLAITKTTTPIRETAINGSATAPTTLKKVMACYFIETLRGDWCEGTRPRPGDAYDAISRPEITGRRIIDSCALVPPSRSGPWTHEKFFVSCGCDRVAVHISASIEGLHRDKLSRRSQSGSGCSEVMTSPALS